jgi:CheY-like chemotaxis protein
VRILLVDDSKAILHENERVLIEAGYEVVCAEDGDSALQLAHEQKPDLILLDMILPKMSGPDVLEHLKKDAATADIPVVVLSSLTEKNRPKLIEAGAEDYVEKN